MKNFRVSDHSTGSSYQTDGIVVPINGRPGHEVNFSTSTDSFTITTRTPDVCILTGSGDDTISAAGVSGGPVVIDAGTGMNFITGGQGNTTFQAEGGAAGTMDIVKNFVAGDCFQLNGGFTLDWSIQNGSAVLTATEAGSEPVSVQFQGIGSLSSFITLTGHGGGQENILLRQPG